jgi:hypothetical protein
LALLLAGNLGIVTVPALFESVAPTEQTTFASGVTARYEAGWFGPEQDGRDTWRWASGPATLVLDNSGAAPRAVTLDFQLRAATSGTVTVAAGAGPPRPLALPPGRLFPVHLGPFVLPPGRTEIAFSTDVTPVIEPGPDQRRLAFSLHRLFVNVARAR